MARPEKFWRAVIRQVRSLGVVGSRRVGDRPWDSCSGSSFLVDLMRVASRDELVIR